jgi:hypothetical protein
VLAALAWILYLAVWAPVPLKVGDRCTLDRPGSAEVPVAYSPHELAEVLLGEGAPKGSREWGRLQDLLGAHRAVSVRPGTEGRVIGSDGRMIRVHVLTGDHSGENWYVLAEWATRIP